MEKQRKHRFVHPDPEMSASKPAETTEKTKKIASLRSRGQVTSKDLKTVLSSIAFFSALLVAFYFLNLKFDLLTRFGDLLNI